METSVDGIVSYVARAVDAMAEIAVGLGDDRANQRPDLPGANSPYVILRHCLGVMEFWGGHVVAGREVDRDRDAEFRSSGPVADLIAAAQEAKRQFQADAATADPADPPRGERPGMSPDELELASQGHALLHVLEEVCQHLGQMELTRDVLAAR
ncbi:MAG TPA: DinB family protein [Streptosporangiaceae bacterium]